MVRIQLAEVPIQMNNQYPDLEQFCHGYETDMNPEILLSLSQVELEKERHMQTGKFSDGYLETVAMYRKLSQEMLLHNVFILHASVVAVNGEGYAFLAPSGVGKTTQTRLWLEYFGPDARVINGDKPLIRMVPDGDEWKFIAYGTPWQGKERMGCNASVALKAIFFLERAVEPECVPIDQECLVDRLFRQLLLPEDEEKMDKLLQMVDHMVECVPGYLLRCNMTRDSVETAFSRANLC